jgi:hypothetical protein
VSRTACMVLDELLAGFAEAQHDPGFRHEGRVVGGGPLKELKGAVEMGLGPHLGIKAWDGLHIVVQHLRPRFEDPEEGFDCFHGGPRSEAPGRCRGWPFRMAETVSAICSGPSVGKVVACDHGEHAEVQLELGHRSGNPGGFVRVGRAGGGLVHGAEGAAPGATRAQEQEGGGPAAEAFHLIGAARLDADGMKSPALHQPHARSRCGRAAAAGA